MKVLLREDVDNLGYAGEVHDVANGYGRNFLIPRGMAVKATPSVLKQAAAWRARAEARRAELRAEYEALSERINHKHLVFYAKAGEGGRLYGSITMMDVAERLNEALGTDIDRRKFDSQSLRDLGEHRISVHLDRDFHPQIQVFIHPEGEVEGEVVDAEDAAADDQPADEAEMDEMDDELFVETEEEEEFE
jgi:large subunit ribosomal protein L9